jgi:hypothetical protein
VYKPTKKVVPKRPLHPNGPEIRRLQGDKKCDIKFIDGKTGYMQEEPEQMVWSACKSFRYRRRRGGATGKQTSIWHLVAA